MPATTTAPGGEPIDLVQEVAVGPGRDWADDARPALEELEKDPEEVAVFEDAPPTVILEGDSGDGIDDDVEDLFDNLIEE